MLIEFEVRALETHKLFGAVGIAHFEAPASGRLLKAYNIHSCAVVGVITVGDVGLFACVLFVFLL